MYTKYFIIDKSNVHYFSNTFEATNFHTINSSQKLVREIFLYGLSALYFHVVTL